MHPKILHVKMTSLLPLLFFLSDLILIGCSDCKYTTTENYIESNCPIEQGFFFQEINVLSFKDSLPDSLEVVRTIEFGLIKEGMKPSKKIFFYKENKNYEWNDIENAILSRTLPIKMESGKWYIIRGLVFLGHPNRAEYLHTDEDGNFHVYGYSESKNW